jgi:tripartite-type tricarboxylate transporter receptor subunit TctC
MPLKTRAAAACLSSVALTAGVTDMAHAQEGWPSRPITLIVPFPPGGGGDIVARPLATQLERLFRQPVLVTNRPGAAGAIGTAAAASSKPDGYTLMVTISSFSTVPEVDALFKRPQAFTREQFIPVARLTADPPLLVANPAAQWRSVKELVAAARKRPGEMFYAHSGLYAPQHTAMEIFATAAGIRLQDVPYVGGAPAMTAVLGGHATMLAASPALSSPHVKAGKVRVYATWGAERNALYPEMPTLIELGYRAEFYNWSGMFAVRGTPEPIVRQLREAVRQVVTGEEYRSTMSRVLTPVAYLDAPDFQKFLEVDARRVGEAIRTMRKPAQ